MIEGREELVEYYKDYVGNFLKVIIEYKRNTELIEFNEDFNMETEIGISRL